MTEIVVRKEPQAKGIVEFFKRNKYGVLTALGVFSLGGLYYLRRIINRKSRERKQTLEDTTMKINNKLKTHLTGPSQWTNRQQAMTSQQQSKQIKEMLQRLKFRRQKLLSTSKQFKLQYAEQQILTTLLSQQCVLNIFEVCKQLVDEQELNAIYNKNRKARREVFHHILMNAEIVNDRRETVEMEGKGQAEYCSNNTQELSITDSMQLHITSPRNIIAIKNNLKQKKSPISYPQALSFSQLYYRLVCTLEQDFRYLIEKTQKDLAVFLSTLSTSTFPQSHSQSTSTSQRKPMTTSKLKQRNGHPSSNSHQSNSSTQIYQPIHLDRVCHVLHRAIQYLQQKRCLILQMVRKLAISDQQQLQALPSFIECLVEDEIYTSFGLEMEQIFVQMGQIDKNKQLYILGRQYQQLTESIVHEMCEEVNTDAIYNNELQDSIECQ